jgi:hypothetical protein
VAGTSTTSATKHRTIHRGPHPKRPLDPFGLTG